jgi:uncharacterized PurR-regulated membrane protein YhhQ (DUF165 family)
MQLLSQDYKIIFRKDVVRKKKENIFSETLQQYKTASLRSFYVGQTLDFQFWQLILQAGALQFLWSNPVRFFSP